MPINNKALQKAIYAEITIGGKFWCWHDYTLAAHCLPQDGWEYTKGIKFKYLCTKCGKEKKTAYLMLEPIR